MGTALRHAGRAGNDLFATGERMTYELETAVRYRLHAEELRVIADAAVDATHQKQLRTIAADYEQMADQLEQIDKTNKAIHRQRQPLI